MRGWKGKSKASSKIKDKIFKKEDSCSSFGLISIASPFTQNKVSSDATREPPTLLNHCEPAKLIFVTDEEKTIDPNNQTVI